MDEDGNPEDNLGIDDLPGGGGTETRKTKVLLIKLSPSITWQWQL
jgi:hypothetical protein